MTYGTLLVNLQLGQSNAELLNVSADIAGRFHSRVIGVGACQPMQVVYGDGYASGALYVSSEVVEQERSAIEQEISTAEAEFRAVLGPRVETLEWRASTSFATVADYVAHQARSADLVIAGPDEQGLFLDPSRHLVLGDLVMQLGRPLFIVPAGITRLSLERVLVGWKDTRETRRAIVDALPFLGGSSHVTLLEIASPNDMAAAGKRLDEVLGWLKQHGVVAQAVVRKSFGEDAKQIKAFAEEEGADLIVSGAYGHSRLREWVLGGVTRDLLLEPDRCSLLSH